MAERMKVLVTGGAGYIGSHAVVESSFNSGRWALQGFAARRPEAVTTPRRRSPSAQAQPSLRCYRDKPTPTQSGKGPCSTST